MTNPNDLWTKLPEGFRTELISAWHTVLSAMVVELGVQLSLNQDVLTTMAFSKSLLLAMGAAIIRSGVKAGMQFLGTFLKPSDDAV